MKQQVRKQFDRPVLQDGAVHYRSGLHLRRMAERAADSRIADVAKQLLPPLSAGRTAGLGGASSRMKIANSSQSGKMCKGLVKLWLRVSSISVRVY
jgi:hypothetical protein